MQTNGFRNVAVTIAAALSLCTAGTALAQQKQKVSYKVGAEETKYPYRHTLQIGDEPGHTVGLFEIHRTFSKNAPVINGVRVKEQWTRGYSDYLSNNGLSVNYGVLVMENGDRIFTAAKTMGHADAAGKRSTVSVGHITGGTGKFSGIRGLVRSTGASDGARGFNETSSEIEYWFAGH
jgi:hypothetical protein